MNLFLEYKKKIFKLLKSIESKGFIKVPKKINNITVELPPHNQKAHISCNAAMLLAKENSKKPTEIAKILKDHLMLEFKEFSSIEIAGPGFLNISFDIQFWKKYLGKNIKFKNKYGSSKEKNHELIFKAIPKEMNLYLCPFNSERSLNEKELKKIKAKYHENAIICSDVNDALSQGLMKAETNDSILIFGSFFLYEEILQ